MPFFRLSRVGGPVALRQINLFCACFQLVGREVSGDRHFRHRIILLCAVFRKRAKDANRLFLRRLSERFRLPVRKIFIAKFVLALGERFHLFAQPRPFRPIGLFEAFVELR